MENGWSLFNTTTPNTSGGSRGQNGHYSNIAWNIWDLGGTSRYDWSSGSSNTAPGTAAAAAAYPEASDDHALMLAHSGSAAAASSSVVYAGGAGLHYHPDPHLTCLKLGKRQYFEDTTAAQLADHRHVGVGGVSAVAAAAAAKRGRPFDYYDFGGVGGVVMGPSTSSAMVTVASPAPVPKCQVEGCHVALVDAKDYHRRHKVCDMHSKAPRVVVLGLEQRFCQQCSRFHAVSEFDDSKRSCRRRLAGHNERRRKGFHDSIPRDTSQGHAHSLLSLKNNPWLSTADVSSRSSAALHELIAENRASILAKQLLLERNWHRFNHCTAQEDGNSSNQAGSDSLGTSHHQNFPESQSWDRFNEGAGHVTLDLMQASNEEQEQCSELWRSLGGAHLV